MQIQKIQKIQIRKKTNITYVKIPERPNAWYIFEESIDEVNLISDYVGTNELFTSYPGSESVGSPA